LTVASTPGSYTLGCGGGCRCLKETATRPDGIYVDATFGAGGILQTGKFEVGIYSWINGVDPDDSTLWMCNQFPPAGQDVYHFCNRNLDAAEQTALADYDPAQRTAAYATIQQILTQQEPMIVLYYARRLDIANADFTGYKPAHAVSEFWNTWEWNI